MYYTGGDEYRRRRSSERANPMQIYTKPVPSTFAPNPVPSPAPAPQPPALPLPVSSAPGYLRGPTAEDPNNVPGVVVNNNSNNAAALRGLTPNLVMPSAFSRPISAAAAVLEPDRHLARLEPEVLRQLDLPLRLELVLHLEALLQKLDLVNAQTPLLPGLVLREILLQIVVQTTIVHHAERAEERLVRSSNVLEAHHRS